jgi:hypothetical protein
LGHENIVATLPILKIHITPAGHLRYAAQFLRAARASRDADPTFPSHVPYYLTCHAVELALKAFLRLRRVPSETLKKKLGHDLEKLLEQADDEHLAEYLTPDARQRSALKRVNTYYRHKVLEYFSRRQPLRGPEGLSNLGTLDSLAHELIDRLWNPRAAALFPEGVPADFVNPLDLACALPGGGRPGPSPRHHRL